MSFLPCKNCGSESVSSMNVDLGNLDQTIQIEDSLDLDQLLGIDESESHFFTCQVCGDNWMSIKEGSGSETEITFLHQMGIKPILRRVAIMATSVVLNESTVDEWEYFYGEELISEETWRKRLAARREVLKAICSN